MARVAAAEVPHNSLYFSGLVVFVLSRIATRFVWTCSTTYHFGTKEPPRISGLPRVVGPNGLLSLRCIVFFFAIFILKPRRLICFVNFIILATYLRDNETVSVVSTMVRPEWMVHATSFMGSSMRRLSSTPR